MCILRPADGQHCVGKLSENNTAGLIDGPGLYTNLVIYSNG